jgi:hypothetical protein
MYYGTAIMVCGARRTRCVAQAVAILPGGRIQGRVWFLRRPVRPSGIGARGLRMAVIPLHPVPAGVVLLFVRAFAMRLPSTGGWQCFCFFNIVEQWIPRYCHRRT